MRLEARCAGREEHLLGQVREQLRRSPGLARKREIGRVVGELTRELVLLEWPPCFGEDAAAIPQGEGYLLLAADGIHQKLLSDPFWAGYCSVLVNVNDILASGGRPLGMVNVVSGGDSARRQELAAGMAFGSRHFGVPMIGGHVHPEGDEESVAVAILGSARSLLDSFSARPGDELLVAVDLSGAWHEPFAHWDSTTFRPASLLWEQMQVVPRLTETGVLRAGKDISNPGLLGTLLMLMETSGVGAEVDLDVLPLPANVSLTRWLEAYPGLGFVLAVPAGSSAEAVAAFMEVGVAARAVGRFTRGSSLVAISGGQSALLWDVARRPVTGVMSSPEPVS